MDKETWPKSGDFLHELAANNLTMSKALIELSDKATQANKTAKLLQARLNQLQDDFELTRKRIKVMGLSRKSGQLLQSRRGSLLTSRADSRVAENRRDEIVLASLAGDDLLQERQDFLVLKNNIYNQLDKLDTHLTREQNDMLTIQAFLLLESYRKLLEDTGEVYIEYLGILNSQEAAQKEIDALSKQYCDYINQRMFWTQSTGLISADGIKDAGKAIAWLANSSNWAKLASDFKFSINERPSIWGMLLIAAAVLIFLRPRFNRQIKTIDERVGQTGEDSIGKTFAGMLLTLLQAAGILFVIYLGARHLWHLPAAHNFTRAFCSGVFSTTEAVILAGIIIRLCRPLGMGRIHFGWSETACDLVERSVKLLLLVFVPIFFFVVMIHNGPQGEGYRSSLGRLLFILSMIPIALVLVRGLKASSPLLEAIRQKRPDGWLNKHHRGWSSAIIAIPLILIVLAVLGYYFTAYELGKDFGNILWLLIILVTADAVMNRGLHLAQVKIAIEKGKAEREAAKLQAAKSAELPEDAVEAVARIAEPALEVEEINEQTSMLIRSAVLIGSLLGLCLILGDIFPAFRFLDNVQLWHHQAGVDESGEPVLAPITLYNLLVALVIFAGTIVAVRGTSALLKVVALKGTKIDSGSRKSYALICRYVISAIGLFLGLDALGIGWDKFQWIAAAMTLGLSFGLQDIFANFVSGVIILLERPVRVGDVVTIGSFNGCINRIRIRSTTITDWDRHDVIIPNKAFLSEKIINWTLSDNIIRVVSDVGIGYGSDAVKAEQLLLQIAKDNPLVKKEPGPSVVLSGFGADSLDFKLRVFVAMSDRVKVGTQIRHEINKTFKEAGIEIPNAQRDTHLDTSAGPLEIRMVNGEDTVKVTS